MNYLFGPKKVSKSILLFYQRKQIITYETLNLFSNYNEMKSLDIDEIFRKINYTDDILLYIHDFLNILLNQLRLIKKTVITIIDNISMDQDEKNNSKTNLKKIISLIKMFPKNVKIIISGNGKYFNQKFIELYENICIQRMVNESEFGYILSLDNKMAYKFINVDKKNYKNFILNEEKSLDRYPFQNLIFSEELDNKCYNKKDINEIKNILYECPLEYFNIKLEKNNYYFFIIN